MIKGTTRVASKGLCDGYSKVMTFQSMEYEMSANK